MKSLDLDTLQNQPLSLELAGLLHALGEYKGKQDLYTHQTPQVLETLKQAALIQSTESSNRIEGITIVPDRLKALLINHSRPKDRPEAEILGYRNVLSEIHTRFGSLDVTPPTILRFHERMMKGTGLASGAWKRSDNTIEEKLPNGKWVTRFVPVTARETPYYIEESCKSLHRLWVQGRVNRLLLIASFVLDFLCIHPFGDGNGRISRLLTVLLLHKAGYEVGRFISLERIIEESKESYYARLHEASQEWHRGRHGLQGWWEYFLTTLVTAYQEFEGRIGSIQKVRGAKTGLILSAIDNLPKQFRISDLVRACPSVGRDMIRVILNRLRSEKKLKCTGAGRGALWEKKES